MKWWTAYIELDSGVVKLRPVFPLVRYRNFQVIGLLKYNSTTLENPTLPLSWSKLHNCRDKQHANAMPMAMAI